MELDTDLRFPGDAALRVRLFRHYLDDVVDFVPVGEPGQQFDAPGNIAWGQSFESYDPDLDYKLRETDGFRQLRMVNAFVETTAIPGFKLKLQAYSVTGDTEKRERRLHEPDRKGVLALREVSSFRPGTWWMLTLSGSF